MNILGIDPALNSRHTCVFKYGDDCLIREWIDMEAQPAPNIIVLEKPVPQGDRCKFKSYTELCKEYGALLATLRRLYPKARIFEVPVSVIREQVFNIEPFSRGKHDPRIKAHMRLLGLGVKKGELFGDSVDREGKIFKPPDGTHKRDAWACSQFNWKDVRNSIYEVKK